MRVYQGKGYEGVSIVNYGLMINVTNGKAIVEYNDLKADFYETLKSGQLSGIVSDYALDDDQIAWLDDSKTWVKTQLGDT
jgi:hypothetical protein